MNIDEESKNDIKKYGRSHVNKIKCFEYGKVGHIVENYFSK